ncbi:hypothetical protein MMC29_002158 [Sticta canariensis]|nr:hypothetical protein [Sticta canariensis]
MGKTKPFPSPIITDGLCPPSCVTSDPKPNYGHLFGRVWSFQPGQTFKASCVALYQVSASPCPKARLAGDSSRFPGQKRFDTGLLRSATPSSSPRLGRLVETGTRWGTAASVNILLWRERDWAVNSHLEASVVPAVSAIIVVSRKNISSKRIRSKKLAISAFLVYHIFHPGGIEMNFVLMNVSNIVELLTVPLLWIRNLKIQVGKNAGKRDQQEHDRRIEDHPNGYPRLAAFVTADPAFAVVRGFKNLHARNILMKQDRLSELEIQLNDVDAKEDTQLFLSSRRHDQNPERRQLLADIDDALRAYERAISCYRGMTVMSRPTASSVRSVVNWMDGNKPLVRSESMFLDHRDDLLSFASADDHAVFDELVEWLLIKIVPKRFAASMTRARTDDVHTHLYEPHRVEQISRLIVTLTVVLLLSLPMAVLSDIPSDHARFGIILLSTMAFAAVLSITTTARKAEIFAATAA